MNDVGLYMAYVSCKQHLEIFLEKMSDARETANCSFTGITHISERDFQMLFAVKGDE